MMDRQMKHRISLSTWAAALGLLIAACTAQKIDRPALPDTSRVNLVGVSRDIVVDDIRNYETGGLLAVQVTLMNKARSPYDVKYLFEWFDQRGVQQYAPSVSWTRRTILTGQHVQLLATAPNDRTTNWRLTVRPWDK